MVLKASRNHLNTGNTIRTPASVSLRKIKTSGFVIAETTAAVDHCVDKEFEFKTVFPDTAVRYSINKKGRWNYPNELRMTIAACEIDDISTSVRVTLTEGYHTLRENRCFAFHSTAGPLRYRSAKSNNWMDETSAQQEVKETDCLSKKARRSIGQANLTSNVIEELPRDSVPSSKQYDLRVTYGTPITANLCSKINKLERSSARKQSRRGPNLLSHRDLLGQEVTSGFMDVNPELCSSDEDEIESTNMENFSSTALRLFTLADFCVPISTKV